MEDAFGQILIFAVRYRAVLYMVMLCVLWLTVRYMAATVRFMVNCALFGYFAFYGLYISYVYKA